MHRDGHFMQFEPSTSRHGNPADWNIPPQLSRFTNRQISVCLLEEIPKMAKMRSTDQEREALPVASDKKGALPVARRFIHDSGCRSRTYMRAPVRLHVLTDHLAARTDHP